MVNATEATTAMLSRMAVVIALTYRYARLDVTYAVEAGHLCAPELMATAPS